MFSVAISIVHSWCPLISKMVDCYTCAEQQQQSSFLAVVVVIVVVIVVVVVVVVKCYMAPSHCVSAAVNHYRCPYCEKTCPNPSSLRIHVHYRHTEDRPYKCPSCNYWWEPVCAVNVVVRPSLCRLSVFCLSVTFVRPTQAIEIFRTFSSPFGTLAICWHPGKILRRSSHGNPSVGGVKHNRGSRI